MSYTQAGELFPCSYCGAAAGERCVTRSGRRATCQHAARHYQVQAVVNLAGYREEMFASYRARRARIDDLQKLIEQVQPIADRGEQINTAGWLLPRLRDLLQRAKGA